MGKGKCYGASMGRAPFALGFAGLLPPLIALALVAFGPEAWRGPAWSAGVVYAAIILSFLGGTWWAFAMRAGPARRPLLAALAVLPSLAAWAVVLVLSPPWVLVLAGLIAATLPIDRLFERLALAPVGWMRLRVPLSVGLSLITLALGVIGLRAGA